VNNSEDGGGISVGDMKSCLADRKAFDPENPTSEDIAAFRHDLGATKDKVKKVINQLSTYSSSIPGTAIHMHDMKRKIISIMSSVVVLQQCEFTWFATNAFSDLYFTPLYAILLHDTSSKSYEHCVEEALKLSKSERQDMLRNHPALVARVYTLQQEAFFKHVLCGLAKPLGMSNIVVLTIFQLLLSLLLYFNHCLLSFVLLFNYCLFYYLSIIVILAIFEF
jgi:hypothetical protein